MEIIVSGRHFEVSDDLKKYAEDRLRKLGEEYPKVTTARLVFHMERSWHIAEAHVTGKHIELEAKAQTQDMYTSTDEAFAKIEKQLRKHLERMHEHKGAAHLGEALAAGTAEATVADEAPVAEEEA